MKVDAYTREMFNRDCERAGIPSALWRSLWAWYQRDVAV